MVTDTAENPAEKADFVTTMRHIVAITKRDDMLTTLRTVVDELDECAERIHRSTMSYEIPSRADLERITDLQCAFEDAADDVKTYCNGASTAADLPHGPAAPRTERRCDRGPKFERRRRQRGDRMRLARLLRAWLGMRAVRRIGGRRGVRVARIARALRRRW